MSVTRQHIIDGLRHLGLGPGSVIVVHSSLRSFGHVEGGAETVIAALKDTVTRDGLVVMPVHPLSMEGHPEASPFDPATSVGYTGRIPNVFWRQVDVVRSLHPTHSDAAWGDRAEELVADHDRRSAVGRDSPLHRAALWGGQVLQLGVSHGTNTMLHLAQALAKVPYMHVRYRALWGDKTLVRRPDGTVARVGLPENEWPGCSGGFGVMDPLLNRRGLTRETLIGRCRARVTPAMPMVELAVEKIRKDPCFLLCTRPGCEHCDGSRRAISEAEAKADR